MNRLSALVLAVLLPAVLGGCQPDDRVDGDNPRHTDAEDYEQDAYEAERGDEGLAPDPRVPTDDVPASGALGDTLVGQ